MLYSKIWTSEQFGKLSDKAKLLYIGTITLADDDGRLRGNPSYLRSQVFPYDEEITVAEVLRLRNEVEKTGLMHTYEVDSFDFIQHPKWEEYQTIRRDLYKKSSLPVRNESVTKPLRKRTLIQSNSDQDKSTEDIPAKAGAFEAFWSSYPKREMKKKSQDIWKVKKLDNQLEAILAFIVKAKDTDRWRKGYIKAPPVFLRNESWNDDLSSYNDKNHEVTKVLKL